MLNTYEQLKPNYSLADLFNDIRQGNKKEYQYNEKTYNVIQTFPKWIINRIFSTRRRVSFFQNYSIIK